jgi:hypothetical protein
MAKANEFEHDDIAELDSAMSALDSVASVVLGKIAKGSASSIVDSESILDDIEDRIINVGVDTGALAEAFEQRIATGNQQQQVIPPETEPDSELPCCDDSGSGGNESGGNESGGNESGGNESGGTNGGTGGTGGPELPNGCKLIDGKIVCPEPTVDDFGMANLSDSLGNIVSMPAAYAKGFAESVAAEKLSVCPPFDVCRDPTKTTDTVRANCCPVHNEPNCRVCNDDPSDPTPSDCGCPYWAVYFDPVTCSGIVVPADTEREQSSQKYYDKYDSEQVADSVLADLINSCREKTEKAEAAENEFKINPCKESFLKAFSLSADEGIFNGGKLLSWVIWWFFAIDTDDKDSLTDNSLDPFGRIKSAINILLGRIPDSLDKIQDSITKYIPADQAGVMIPATVEAVLAFLEHWLGSSFTRWKKPFEYSANIAMPYILPTVEEASNAWLRGFIDDNQVEDWIKFNGRCPDQHSVILDSQQAVPTVGELVRGRYRGIINRQEYNTLHRRLGFTDQRLAQFHLDLFKFIPPPQDIIRLMIRDVMVPDIVERFNLDDGFTGVNGRYGGLLKEFANKQGVDDDTMRLLWRAHWSIPGPSQLFEMYHRLRYADIDPELRTTIDDVEAALVQQDIPRFWVNRLLETSFRVPTRVDGRRMFRINVINGDEYQRILERHGYKTEDAIKLVEFGRQNKFRGLFTERPVREYGRGLIDKAEATLQLAELKYDAADINKVLETVDKAFTGKTRLECTKALRTRYMQGEFTDDQTRAELVGLGWAGDRAQQLSQRWACVRAARPKLASVSTIRELMEFFLIDAREAALRLVNFGFRKEDAILTVTAIVAKIENKAADELAKLRDRLKRELDKATRKKQQAERKSKSKESKESDDAEKERKAAENRDNQLTKAVQKHNAAFGTEFDDIYLQAAELRDELQNDLKVSPTVANQSVVQGLNQSVKLKDENFAELAKEIANARLGK